MLSLQHCRIAKAEKIMPHVCGRVPSLLQWQGNLCSAYITTLSIYSSGNSPAVAGRGVGKNMGEVGGGGGGEVG